MNNNKKQGEIDLHAGHDIKPKVTNEEVSTLVESLYGLKVTTMKEMNSYIDKVYHITVEPVSNSPHIEVPSAEGYTLKVINTQDSQDTHLSKSTKQQMNVEIDCR